MTSSNGWFVIAGVAFGGALTGGVTLVAQRSQFRYTRSLASTERIQQRRSDVYLDLMQYANQVIGNVEQGGMGQRALGEDLDLDRLKAAVDSYGSEEIVSKLGTLVGSLQDLQSEITALESRVHAGDRDPSQDVYLARAASVVEAAAEVRSQIRSDLESDQSRRD